jgi:hypothetical protein
LIEKLLPEPAARRTILGCLAQLYDREFPIAGLPRKCRVFKAEHEDCFGSPVSDGGDCKTLRQYFQETQFVREKCLENFATRRAESVYTFCRDSIRDSMFNFNAIESGRVLPEALDAADHRDYMTLRRIWLNRVRFAGETPRKPLVEMRGNDLIYLTVQFDLQHHNSN